MHTNDCEYWVQQPSGAQVQQRPNGCQVGNQPNCGHFVDSSRDFWAGRSGAGWPARQPPSHSDLRSAQSQPDICVQPPASNGGQHYNVNRAAQPPQPVVQQLPSYAQFGQPPPGCVQLQPRNTAAPQFSNSSHLPTQNSNDMAQQQQQQPLFHTPPHPSLPQQPRLQQQPQMNPLLPPVREHRSRSYGQIPQLPRQAAAHDDPSTPASPSPMAYPYPNNQHQQPPHYHHCPPQENHREHMNAPARPNRSHSYCESSARKAEHNSTLILRWVEHKKSSVFSSPNRDYPPISIWVDGNCVGSLFYKQETTLPVTPGMHHIKVGVVSEGPSVGFIKSILPASDHRASCDVNTQPAQRYYFNVFRHYGHRDIGGGTYHQTKQVFFHIRQVGVDGSQDSIQEGGGVSFPAGKSELELIPIPGRKVPRDAYENNYSKPINIVLNGKKLCTLSEPDKRKGAGNPSKVVLEPSDPTSTGEYTLAAVSPGRAGKALSNLFGVHYEPKLKSPQPLHFAVAPNQQLKVRVEWHFESLSVFSSSRTRNRRKYWITFQPIT